MLDAKVRHGRRAGVEHAATDALIAVGLLTVLVSSAWLATSDSLEAAPFPVVVILAAATFTPVLAVNDIARELNLAGAAAARVTTILDATGHVADRVSQPPAGHVRPHVAFDRVSFRYSQEHSPAVDEISFEIAPGETVALVGVVPQDVYLFNEPLRDNIRLGRPDATDAEVRAAARAALADEFVSALPNGYDTTAGELGGRLSGGQRQRIAIARALLKDAPILVMDEAMSNLDAESERAVAAAMAVARRGRTTLVIAHRLSTIRTADRLVVLDGGRVAEVGTHDELLDRGDTYTRLITAQMTSAESRVTRGEPT